MVSHFSKLALYTVMTLLCVSGSLFLLLLKEPILQRVDKQSKESSTDDVANPENGENLSREDLHKRRVKEQE